MKNKETLNGVKNDRPCFFVFPDNKINGILWLIPITSNYEKYKAEYDKKVARYGRCNTIRFGTVLDTQAAFLIQNMCPITIKYIREIYVDKNNVPIQIDNRIVKDIVYNARYVLAKAFKGVNIIFPDVRTIYKALQNQLENQVKTLDKV